MSWIRENAAVSMVLCMILLIATLWAFKVVDVLLILRIDSGFGISLENRRLIWKIIEVTKRLHPEEAQKIYNEVR